MQLILKLSLKCYETDEFVQKRGRQKPEILIWTNTINSIITHFLSPSYVTGIVLKGSYELTNLILRMTLADKNYYYPHFTVERMETQRVELSCSRSYS